VKALETHDEKARILFNETEMKVTTPASEVDVGLWNESWFFI
jgi:hypothetical protein